MIKLDNLTTEAINAKSSNLDQMSGKEIAQIMNNEDQCVALAIETIITELGMAVEVISKSLADSGRLIYIGAGTSGRLGILDAVECLPTFGIEPDVVIGLIAGGEKAIVTAIEGAEDSKELGVSDLEKINLQPNDVVVGIAASGRTPYVIGALEYANSIGAETIAVACNKKSEIGKVANLALEVELGAEVLTGSTRLKAGSAQKMILNILSTGAMVRIGKVYKNLMVDVQPTNAKLIERMKNIVAEATGVSRELAEATLIECGNIPKVAIVMILLQCSVNEAINRLENTHGFVGNAIK